MRNAGIVELLQLPGDADQQIESLKGPFNIGSVLDLGLKRPPFILTDSTVTEHFRNYCSNRANYLDGMPLPETGWDLGPEVRVTRAQAIDASRHADRTCKG